ncbi:hypothetical protein V8C35DRAFT_286992 [Trichoderma chlorosporum]
MYNLYDDSITYESWSTDAQSLGLSLLCKALPHKRHIHDGDVLHTIITSMQIFSRLAPHVKLPSLPGQQEERGGLTRQHPCWQSSSNGAFCLAKTKDIASAVSTRVFLIKPSPSDSFHKLSQAKCRLGIARMQLSASFGMQASSSRPARVLRGKKKICKGTISGSRVACSGRGYNQENPNKVKQNPVVQKCQEISQISSQIPRSPPRILLRPTDTWLGDNPDIGSEKSLEVPGPSPNRPRASPGTAVLTPDLSHCAMLPEHRVELRLP